MPEAEFSGSLRGVLLQDVDSIIFEPGGAAFQYCASPRRIDAWRFGKGGSLSGFFLLFVAFPQLDQ